MLSICTFDPFIDGRHIYTFENRCLENPSLSLGDETTKIFLNTKGILDDVDEELLEFLSYMENTTDAYAEQVSSPLIKEIQKKVKEVKESKEMEVEYMTLYMRDMENREIGREEGIKALILDNLESGVEKDIIVAKVIRHFNVKRDEAEAYYEKYAMQPV